MKDTTRHNPGYERRRNLGVHNSRSVPSRTPGGATSGAAPGSSGDLPQRIRLRDKR